MARHVTYRLIAGSGIPALSLSDLIFLQAQVVLQQLESDEIKFNVEKC